MFTRKDYLEKRCSHEEYYRQFVTESVRQSVSEAIGIDKLKASKDEHLNDIPLRHWDDIALSCAYEVRGLLPPDDFYSLSTGVCVAKQAAKMLVEKV